MMSDEYMHTGLSLVGKHIPDYSYEKDNDGNNQKIELPGHYQVGVVIDGVFKPLAQYGAQGLFKDIERVKASQRPVSGEPVE